VAGANLDELVRGLGHKHVMGRVGRPEEVGRVIYFLADAAQSSFVTGPAVVVDGGALARLSTE
jgi:NAD(P)-dependent dehydrogenase (short-subunit alcohol dehydrogenase family)